MFIFRIIVVCVFIFSAFWGCDEDSNPVGTVDTVVVKDSMFVFDTIFSYDTTTKLDTVFSFDTTTRLDTVYSIDTLVQINNDTMIIIDSVIISINDTVYVHDTILNYFTDPRDGQVYRKTKIGNQVWMAENLAYLPQVDNAADGSAEVGNPKFYYVYDYVPSGDDEAAEIANAKASANYQTYGVLYNWHAAMDAAASSSAAPSGVKGACPEGWHLPSDLEWKELEIAIGMAQSEADDIDNRGTTEGQELKTSSWGGNDAHGFSALPAGLRWYEGSFYSIDSSTTFWTATEIGPSHAWQRYLALDNDDIVRSERYKNAGFSVRCLKD